MKYLKNMLFYLLIFSSFSLFSKDWPIEFIKNDVHVTLYQLQLDNFYANEIRGRAVVELNNGSVEYSTILFKAKINTNLDTNLVIIRDFFIEKIISYGIDKKTENYINLTLRGVLNNSVFKMKATSLYNSSSAPKREKPVFQYLNNTPPNIIFTTEPSILLNFNGEPRFFPIFNGKYERASNIPFVLIKEPITGVFYLTDGNKWYQSYELNGVWRLTNSIPEELLISVPKTGSSTVISKFIFSTSQAEIIETKGEPNWIEIDNSTLSYVNNSNTPWLKDMITNVEYILLSGRWFYKEEYRSWTYISNDKLPLSFKDIPLSLDISWVRASIPNTKEADAAIIGSKMLQTGLISKSEKLDIFYDGEPKFIKIANTRISYAINTLSQVIQVNNVFYALDGGVWFKSFNKKGPFIVADQIPKNDIDKIPPSSPIFNMTFVHLFETMDNAAYFGYTQGYLWSFPVKGTNVYGTGWNNIEEYYGVNNYYYPNYPTWGMNLAYKEGYGWGTLNDKIVNFYKTGEDWNVGWIQSYRPWEKYRLGSNNFKMNKVTNIYNLDKYSFRNVKPNLSISNYSISTKNNDLISDRKGNIAKLINNHWFIYVDGEWIEGRVLANQDNLKKQQNKPLRLQKRLSQNNTNQQPSMVNPKISGVDYTGLSNYYESRIRSN